MALHFPLWRGLALALCALSALPACDETDDIQQPQSEAPDAGEDPGAERPEACIPDEQVVRPRSQPIEFVGLTVTREIQVTDFLEIMGGIYGAEAKAGDRHEDYPLQEGLFLTTEADPRTGDQVVLRLDMMAPKADQGPERRTIFRAPVSFEYGELYIETVQAALARMEEVLAEDPGDARPWFLEHNIRSVNGGQLTIRVDATAGGEATLSFKSESPATSLADGRVNEVAFAGDPYETLGGTVFFQLGRDEFDFFVTRAYGLSGAADQNFSDFYLLPHNWLRLTVTPLLEEGLVDVAFEVVTLDGRRLPFARAPASIIAGEQFQQNVLRMVDNMLAIEEAAPGTAPRWEAPFHYDDPDGGGVVKVIASGERGTFRIAYAVDSPAHYLRPVDFLPYQGEVEVDTSVEPPSTCADLGSEPSAQGTLLITFDASSTVRNSDRLKAELKGNVYGSVFRAADVRGTGPIEGAQSVASFRFDDVDLTDPDNLMAYELPDRLLAGEYQVLGFIDIDGTADPEDADPDQGDPVTVPIGGVTLECATQPVVVEFAILLP